MGLELLNSDDINLIEDFKTTLDKISSILNSLGVSATSYHTSYLKDYSKLSSHQKKSALRDSQKYLECLTASELVEPATDDDRDTPDLGQSLWFALRHFGLRPTSDLFELLSMNDAVEIYNAEGIQVWRNLKFMEVCSYTLEEIFCYTWQDRYTRSEAATVQIMDVISKFSTISPKSIKCGIKNLLHEKFSVKKLTIDVTHEMLSPVFNSLNAVGGFVVTSKVKILQPN
ncbi:MAG: hypothetical protein AABY64_09695 [Bdellovibrionota bacterium]